MKRGENTKTIFKTLTLALVFFALFLLVLSATVVKADPGWNIDLFCPRDGKGPHVTCHYPYAVGERIILYALVTYNEDPVQSVIVAFEVDDPLGSPRIVTVAQTNSTGIATVNFTITENVYPSYPSLWNSIATTSPTQTTVNDTMPFRIVYSLGGISTPILTPPYTRALVIETLIILALIPAAKILKLKRARIVF